MLLECVSQRVMLCNLTTTRGGQARALPKVEKFLILSGKPPSAGAGKLEIDSLPGIHLHCQSPLLGSTILWEKIKIFSILGKGYSTLLSLEEVGKPHINIRWSDDGSDENERI